MRAGHRPTPPRGHARDSLLHQLRLPTLTGTSTPAGRSTVTSVAHLAHLARRFAGSLWPAPLPAHDEAWVRAHLSEREWALWCRLGPADRRHTVGVARRVQASLGADATAPVLAAALLHDIGKLASGLGTWGRVVATVAGAATGGRWAREWAEGDASTGTTGGGRTRAGHTRLRRIGLYLRHASLGAEMLAEAGSDPLVVTWAREHHLPAPGWTLPHRLAHALADADDD